MKTWQWSAIMWGLCMIMYYASNEQLFPLLLSFIFAGVSGYTFGTDKKAL